MHEKLSRGEAIPSRICFGIADQGKFAAASAVLGVRKSRGRYPRDSGGKCIRSKS